MPITLTEIDALPIGASFQVLHLDASRNPAFTFNLYDSIGATAMNHSSRQLFDSAGYTSVDWNSKKLISWDSGHTESRTYLAWNDPTYGTVLYPGNVAIGPGTNNPVFVARGGAGGAPCVWDCNVSGWVLDMYYATFRPSMNGTVVFNAGYQWLFDGAGTLSMDWNSRSLHGPLGATSMTWSATRTVKIGDPALGGNSTVLTVDDPNKKIILSGGRQERIRVFASGATSYTMQASDYIVAVDTTVTGGGASCTVFLPTSPTNGDTYIVKAVGGPNPLVVDGNGVNIDGQPTFVAGSLNLYAIFSAVYGATAGMGGTPAWLILSPYTF